MINQETSVLIVDPDQEIQGRYRQRLIHDPSIRLVGICSSMNSAVSLLSQTGCDVLFTEMILPDGNGADLLRHATMSLGIRNCVVITSANDSASIAAAFENGAIGYILKAETTAADTASFVRLVQSGGSPISPSVARVVVSLMQQRKSLGSLKSRRDPQQMRNPLSPREMEILHLLAKGMSFSEIGEVLKISSHTVTTHIKKIYRKLQVHSRGEAVYEAIQMGLLSD